MSRIMIHGDEINIQLYSKTLTIQFITKNFVPTKVSTFCYTEDIVEVSHPKFLGLESDNAFFFFFFYIAKV
jgi:hypothetical protein